MFITFSHMFFVRHVVKSKDCDITSSRFHYTLDGESRSLSYIFYDRVHTILSEPEHIGQYGPWKSLATNPLLFLHVMIRGFDPK